MSNPRPLSGFMSPAGQSGGDKHEAHENAYIVDNSVGKDKVKVMSCVHLQLSAKYLQYTARKDATPSSPAATVSNGELIKPYDQENTHPTGAG